MARVGPRAFELTVVPAERTHGRMKIAVIGASGGCGQQLVAQALERGHQVRAVVRPSSSWQAPPGAERIAGDLCDTAFLTGAVAGCEVVLSALGLRIKSIAPWAKPEVADFLSRCTPVLVAAMKAAGMTRVIAISAGGVGDSQQQVPPGHPAKIIASLPQVAPESVGAPVAFRGGAGGGLADQA